MSFSEIVVVLFGLFIGYWIVSKLTSGKPQSKRTKDHDADHQAQSEEARPPPTTQSQAASWSSILGVMPSATVDEIRLAYKVQMSQYHPDKVASLGSELRALAERKTKEIAGAYRQALRSHGVGE